MIQQPKQCLGCQLAEPIFPFTMAFQPIVDVEENRIDAFEALVRGVAGEGRRLRAGAGRCRPTSTRSIKPAASKPSTLRAGSACTSG